MQCVNYKNVYGDEEQVECQYMKDYYENLKQKYNAIDKDMNEHINSIQKTLDITNLSTEQVLKINKYFNKLYHNYYKLNMLYIQDNEQNFSKENKMQNYKESLTNILDKIRTLNSMDQYKNTAIQNIILPKKIKTVEEIEKDNTHNIRNIFYKNNVCKKKWVDLIKHPHIKTQDLHI